MKVSVHTNMADGRTLESFKQVLGNRMKYMHETARDSIAAMAINTLKSVRAVTAVAKPNSPKVKVKKSAEYSVGFTTRGKVRHPVVRIAGSGVRYAGPNPVKIASDMLVKGARVYKFSDDATSVKRTYLIVANTDAEAKAKAKQIVRGRMARYAGLAKRAIGCLMMKTSTVKVSDQVSPKVHAKAMQVSAKREVIAKSADSDGGKYSLILEDQLKYALLATKGGKAAVDMAMKKAMNKVTSVINKKIKDVDFLGRRMRLDTPFPEVQRKNR